MTNAVDTVVAGATYEAGPFLITPEYLHAYAEASGDFNPLHLDAAYAATTSFKQPIAHGMLLFAYIGQVLATHFGTAWLNSTSIKVRFKAPAFLHNLITARVVVDRLEETADPASEELRKRSETRLIAICTVECVNERGERLVTGDARIRL